VTPVDIVKATAVTMEKKKMRTSGEARYKFEGKL
jgi:hypothetical protein